MAGFGGHCEAHTSTSYEQFIMCKMKRLGNSFFYGAEELF